MDGSPRIFRRPAHEIERLQAREHAWTDVALIPGKVRPLGMRGDLLHILADVEVSEDSALVFRVRGTPVALTNRSIACNGEPATVLSRLKTVEILVDRTSIEAFANDGEVSLSACFLPTDDHLEVESRRGPVKIRSLRVFELRSMWGEKPE